jgi:uncharacterized membrane protein YgcG
MEAMKQALKLLFHTKCMVSPLHEFALAALTDECTLLCALTSDVSKLCESVDMLEAVPGVNGQVDLCKALDVVVDTLGPVTSKQRFCRAVVVFSRSHHVPTFGEDPVMYRELNTMDNFVCDALYVHFKKNDKNHPQEVYDKLVDLEKAASGGPLASYMLETHSETGLYRCVSALNAHPMQRIPQDKIKWVMTPCPTTYAQLQSSSSATGGGAGGGGGGAAAGAGGGGRAAAAPRA